ncbi:MAG: phosphodiesterase [Armatimonadetes bacterium]|nr:phosphodiesterase [Armatimonadota bacterium]
MFQKLTRGFQQLLLGGRDGEQSRRPEVPQHFHSQQARLKVEQVGDQVHVTPDFTTNPRLRLGGQLAGSVSAIRGEAAGRPAILLSFPMFSAGQQDRIQVTTVAHGPALESLRLIRATRRRIPEGQAVEVAYAEGESHFRYLVEMPLRIEVCDFEEYSETRAIFDEVPPVSQMVAFLKATIHHRRTSMRSLGSMARRCNHPAVRKVVELMESRLSQGHDFTNQGVSLARDYLEQRGRSIYPNTVAALCLLADVYLGKVGAKQIERLVEEKAPLETSPEAARAVAAFFGLRGTSQEWKKLLPPGMKTARWRDSRRAAEFLQGALGQRTALTILQDLSEDSGSDRSRSRVSRLLARVPADQVLVNDEHLALCEYLATLERTVQPDTIAAMGIYVDFEAGILSEEDIDSLAPQRGFWDTSLYGMVAISGAFDAELRAFLLSERRSDRRWAQLAHLAELAEGGVIARFLEKGQPGYTTLFLDFQEGVEQARKRGLRFTGEVLARLPTIDHLDEPDLEALWSTGMPVMACFGSESKRVQWRRLSRSRVGHEVLDDLLKGEFSFIDGYQVYHFYYSVMARIAEVDPASVTDATHLIAVYRDQRGNAHFHHFPLVESVDQVATPPEHGWEWQREMIEFPDLTGFPPVLYEVSHEMLLGRPDSTLSGQSRLDRVYGGLQEHLTQPWSHRSLAEHPRRLKAVREGCDSPALAALLMGVADDSALALLRSSLSPGSELSLQLWEPLLQALDIMEATEFASLAMVYGLCTAPTAPALEVFEREKFRELLLDRLFALASSEDPAHRIISCRLLGSAIVSGDEQRRLSASYLLARIMDHDRYAVARNAARSLAALSLAEVLPLPELVKVEPKDQQSGEGSRPLSVDPAEVERLLTEIDDLLGEFEEEPTWANPARLEEAARYLCLLNQAFSSQNSRGTPRYLVTARRAEVEHLYRATIGSWKSFASLFDLELPVLLSNTEPDQLLDSYLEALPQLLKREKLELPVLGGGQAWHTVFRLEPGRGIELTDGIPAVFQHLASQVVPGRPEPLHILRWIPLEEQTPAPGESATVETPLHPHQLELFVPGAGGFMPFLSPEAGPPDYKLELEAMRSLFQPLRTQTIATDRPVEFGSLSQEVSRLFNLGPEQQRVVLHMLAGLFCRRQEHAELDGKARDRLRPAARRAQAPSPPPPLEPGAEEEPPQEQELELPVELEAPPPPPADTGALEERVRQAEERALKAEQALERARERLERLEQEEEPTLEDPLTGLPTLGVMERYLEFNLEQVARYNRTTALLFVEVDELDALGSSLGGRACDELLIQTAARLGQAVRRSDVLGRAGRDRFLILLSELSDWDEATALISIVTNRIRECMEPPFEAAGQQLGLTLSVGVSLCTGRGHAVTEQLDNARRAMERARELGGNQHQFYTEALQQRHEERLSLEYELWSGLDNAEFLLLYQPVVDLYTGRIDSVEALVRWEHPERGLLAPAEFLDAAERTGFVVPLGRWVAGRALEDLRHWLDQGADLAVSINLAARQLLAPNLLDSLATALRDAGVTPRHLLLELPETSAEGERFDRSVAGLLELGCRTVLDRFGTGRSGWKGLAQFSALKIDREFVTRIPADRESVGVCAGAVAVARALGMRSVAVGIEKLDQLRFLQALGCDLGQGTLLADPAPGDRIPGLVREGLALP